MKSVKLSNETSPQIKNRGFFSTIIRENLKRFWALPVIGAIIMILSGPVLYILGLNVNYFYDVSPAADFAEDANVRFLFVFFVLSIGAGLCTFGYLEKKGSSNFIHGLPIKRQHLFTANYISGAIMFILPIVLTGILLMAIFGASSILIMLCWIGKNIFVCLIMYSITIFASVVSGNFFMQLFNSLFFNFFAIIVVAIVSAYFEMLVPGYQASSLVNSLISNSLPVAAFVGGGSLATWIVYILVTIAVVIASLVIYKMRHIERTGESLIFDWTKYLIIGMVSFIGTLLFGTIFQSIFALTSQYGQGITLSLLIGLATGFVCNYIVMSLIVFRTPKIHTKKNLISAAIVGVVVILFIGGIKGDVFGIGNRTIQLDDTSKAAVTLSYKVDTVEGLYFARYDASYFNLDGKTIVNQSGEKVLAFTDTENIEAIKNIQRIAKNHGQESSGYSSGSGTNIYLDWYTKSEEYFSQGYCIDDDTFKMMEPYLTTIYESEEFKDAYKLENLESNIKSVEIYDSSSDTRQNITDKNKIDSLIVAMDKDFEAQTFDQMIEAEKAETYTYIVTIDTGEELDIYLMSSDKNTFDWIAKNAK